MPHQIAERNDAAIKDSLHESDIVVMAWGSTNRFEKRIAFVLDLPGGMKQKILLKTTMHSSRGRYEEIVLPYSQ